MSSIEDNNIKVPPPKPFRRRLSFRTKLSSSLESPANSTSNNALGNGFNAVRGSIRRFRRVSSAVNGTSSPPTSNQNVNNDTNSTQEQTTASSSTNVQSPTITSFQRFCEQTTSRLKEINLPQKIAELTAAVQDETAGIGSMAKEAVFERLKKRKEEPHNSLSSKNVAGINIFGAPLTTAVRLTRIEKDINKIESDPYRYWLPAVMLRCIEFLDMFGLEEIGLYRIPGSSLTVTQMRNIFDSGADLNFLQSSTTDPHVVATLLKMYLRELPEPILTETLLPEFNACVAKHTNSAVVATPEVTSIPATSYPTTTVVSEELPTDLSSIVSGLPPQHFYLLRALCSHLSRVNKKSGINKMNISNLGLIFCPSLGIGSVLFKALVEDIGVVFEIGCKAESEILEEERKELEAKERLAPEVYHRTNISDEFSRSFDDLFSLDAKRASRHSLNRSYPSSSSSSIVGLYVNKDTFNPSNGNQNDPLKNYVINSTIPIITTVSPTLSSSSSMTSPPTPPFKPIRNKNNIEETKNLFSSDGSLSSIDIPSDSNDKRQHTVNIINTAKMTSSSSSPKPPFRMRSRSTGLRDIPFTAFEYSSDSSEEEIEAKEKINNSSFMTFDYLDKHGTKNSGVLNLSPRSNWVLHHNGMRGDRSKATAAWVKRRPSSEETEKWKKILLEDINITETPNVIIDGNTIIHDDDDVENLVGKNKVREQILKFNGMS